MLRLATLAMVTAALVGCGGSSSNETDTGIAVTLVSNGGLSYTGPVKVGGQPFQLVLDTGSTTLGVAASSCTGCGVNPLYTPGASAVDQHNTGSALYADGTGWSGEIFQDSVQLGTAGTVPVKLIAIDSSSGFFRPLGNTTTINYQGILGFAPDGSLLAGTTSYIDGLFGSGGSAASDEFAFQLCPDTGTIWMGGVDESHEASPAAFTPMLATDQIPSYMVNTARMALDTNPDLGSAADFGDTIIDTGTSIAFIPTTPLNALTTQVENSGGFKAVFGSQTITGSSMGCVTTTMTSAQVDAMLPPLHLAFPDAKGAPSTFVDLPATHAYFFFAGTMAGQNGFCFSFADSSALGAPFAISLFGDSILASYVTIFDVGSQEMGFAKEKGCDEASGSAADVRVAPAYTPDRPWWQQDPRVRVPSPATIRQRLAPLFTAP